MPDIRKQLETYAASISDVKKNMDAVFERIRKTEHEDFIHTVCDYFMIPNDDKRNTVWIYGMPNTGKSSFLGLMRKIFTCADYLQTKRQFDCKYTHSKKAPHFILIDEGAHETFFKDTSKYVASKLFFEGQGLVMETKCKDPKRRWRGVPIIISSNTLDDVMYEPKRFTDESERSF